MCNGRTSTRCQGKHHEEFNPSCSGLIALLFVKLIKNLFQNCFELKNLIAIAILGLQSVSVRNLKSSWEVRMYYKLESTTKLRSSGHL